MATLDHTIDTQATTPNPDFGPEGEWKIGLRQHIEDTLKLTVDSSSRVFLRLRTQKLRPTSVMLWLNYVAEQTSSIVSYWNASVKSDNGPDGPPAVSSRSGEVNELGSIIFTEVFPPPLAPMTARQSSVQVLIKHTRRLCNKDSFSGNPPSSI